MSNTPDIKPRRLPGDPTSTHALNALHLLLPAGERWFVHVFKQVLPLIADEGLKERVKGFMGQEGTHAVAHQRVLDHLKGQGLDPAPYVDNVEWLFGRLLGDGTAPPSARASWLRERLAMIAAIEALDYIAVSPAHAEFRRFSG
ncbi:MULTISPECIES: metal-dependent hydrolase [unclassified Nonomuraea]|uniref:metal-dependent hydrolase n=1 Tax=unclassified Nonomuraea TaxID=2593643 RepID=UPI0033C1953A